MSGKHFLIYLLLSLLFLLHAHAQEQATAKVYGKIVDTSDIPLHFVNIQVKDNPSKGCISNEAGRFELIIEANKDIILLISSLGYFPKEVSLNLEPGTRKQINIVLTASSILLPEFSVKENYSPNIGLERINPKTVTHMPSINNSIEKLIKSAGMGVASNNELSSQYNVRGGNYDENLIYLNGFEIYRPFLIRSGQQEGLSFINPDLVSAVNFSSGGFDSEYGDKMSSVLDVRYKVPIYFKGSVSASLLGANGHLEGANKNQKFSYLLGARYQSNAYLIKKMQTKGYYKPDFTDVQLLLTYASNEKWNFSVFGNYARNTYKLVPSMQENTFGFINDIKRLRIYFDGQEVDAFQTVFASFVTTYNYNPKHEFKLILSYFNSFEKETFDIEGQYFLSEVNSNFGSEELGEDLSSRAVGSDLHHGRNFLQANLFHGELRGSHKHKKHLFLWGIKGQGEFIQDKLLEWRLQDSTGYTLPYIPTKPGDSVSLTHPGRNLIIDDYLFANNDLQSFRLSGFVQDKWVYEDSSNIFILTGGLRFAYWTFNNEIIFTPRLRFIYQPKIKSKVSFYVATGLYYQPPFYKEMRRPDGSLNTNIKSQKSYHIILGTDYMFRISQRPFKLSGEMYYKYLDDLITYTLNNVRILYSGVNDAHGYAIGVDAKLSGEIVPGLESWLTISLMKSMEDIEGDFYKLYLDSNRNFTSDINERVFDSIVYPGYVPRLTDQRFSINLFFQDKVPRLPMLKAHINLIYSTPLMYTIPGVSRSLARRMHKAYFRADLGFSWQFINDASFSNPKNPLRIFNDAYLTFEIFNVFNYYNIISYTSVTDINGTSYIIPNYLTPRLFNCKLRFEF